MQSAAESRCGDGDDEFEHGCVFMPAEPFKQGGEVRGVGE